MRKWINLLERAASQTYFHVTDARNIPSILKKGLVPNASNGGNGNYESSEWASLNGVYVTTESDVIDQYIFAHNLHDYAIVVVAVTPQSGLPDEDTIPILFGQCFNVVMDKTVGQTPEGDDWEDTPAVAYDVLDFDDSQDLPEDIAEAVARLFHERVKGNDPRSPDIEMLTLAVQCWWEFKIGYGGDAAMLWPDLKDKIVRRYPRMAHPYSGFGYSLRIPGPVGYSGRNRIIAIVRVTNQVGHLVYGKLNEDAVHFLGPYAPHA